MTKYITTDPNNFILSIIDSALIVKADIPADAIAITDTDFNILQSDADGFLNYRIQNNALTKDVAGRNLSLLPGEKAKAKANIDDFAGSIRAKYITTAIGQSSVYLYKATEADAFKAAGYPETSLANYPLLNAEASALGKTGQQVADGVITVRDQWVQIASQIEAARLKGKADVDNASLITDIANAEKTAMETLMVL